MHKGFLSSGNSMQELSICVGLLSGRLFRIRKLGRSLAGEVVSPTAEAGDLGGIRQGGGFA
jgi:hypothetical protein